MKKKLLLLLLLFNVVSIFFGATKNIEVEFEQRYQKWRIWVKEHSFSSDISSNKYYKSIVDLGLPAVPFIIEKMKKTQFDSMALMGAVYLITKKSFEKKYWPNHDDRNVPGMYIKWWKSGRTNDIHKYKKLQNQLIKYSKENNTNKIHETTASIRKLGILILPYLVEDIEQGNKSLVPIVVRLTSNQIKSNTSIKQMQRWWKKHKDEYRAPPVQKKSNKHDDR